jgi:hypothetical protein
MLNGQLITARQAAATKSATGCYEIGLTCNEAYVFGGRSLQGFCALQDAFS